MNWISTDINPWDLPVAKAAAKEVSLHPTGPPEDRTGAYWVDMDSGDELLLLSFGDANHWTAQDGYLGGQYQLVRHFTQSRRLESITHLLKPIGGGHFSTQSEEPSQQPGRVRARCIDLVERLIDPHRPFEEILRERSQTRDYDRLAQ